MIGVVWLLKGVEGTSHVEGEMTRPGDQIHTIPTVSGAFWVILARRVRDRRVQSTLTCVGIGSRAALLLTSAQGA